VPARLYTTQNVQGKHRDLTLRCPIYKCDRRSPLRQVNEGHVPQRGYIYPARGNTPSNQPGCVLCLIYPGWYPGLVRYSPVGAWWCRYYCRGRPLCLPVYIPHRTFTANTGICPYNARYTRATAGRPYDTRHNG